MAAGWWESVVKNLNLNFSVVYAGYSGLKEIVEKSYKERRGILYYW